MSVNRPYKDANGLPEVLPVFPLTRALLLPRGELPLNIFEPRYLAMIDDAIASQRVIGMIQPLSGEDEREAAPALHRTGCAGRITRFLETGDGRYMISLTGIARFDIMEELPSTLPYRKCRVSYERFLFDLEPGAGEEDVDRSGMIRMLREFAEGSKLEVDWSSIDAAPNEALVNALAMMSPFGANEKQALLEAIDLKSRAEMLVALAELDLAQNSDEPPHFH
ncbi:MULTISPECIES: LON peptidase substrate-binding domain-containing protein [Methylosinus]|uniref:Peptidase S16 n=1 Tax=Methylosinus trichosporium (strain ATCC 35070 / NCIMB 11131 / UNIQEM 75 / OB3b) TaxID=595536 RepID=A0A2D2CX18_METT3|nr:MULTISPECIES: LON peptidase substrate-binding domain-containing protein [Methylosinus]ATQ67298.1 peptidase S16 [Methylosinus trichosporium OB3b]OBS52080.1 peptidase S16 [Methylosinus sp. 3S-1]